MEKDNGVKVLERSISKSGVILFLVGLLLLIGVECLRVNDMQCLSYKILIGISPNLGMACITAGIFDIIIGRKTWQEFFEKILKTVFTDKKYLAGMNKDELYAIQTEVVRQQTGITDIDKEGSFYQFFHKDLLQYMAASYREDVSSSITVIEEGDDLIATEHIEYTCRAGKDNEIQGEIRYNFDKEIQDYTALLEVVITVVLPDNPEPEKPLLEEKHKKEDKITKIESIDIKKYKNMDGLKIRIKSKSIVNKDSFQTWQMVCPSKNVQIHIDAPEKYNIICTPLVSRKPIVFSSVQNVPHSLSLSLNTWMLPQNGFAFRIVKTNGDDNRLVR